MSDNDSLSNEDRGVLVQVGAAVRTAREAAQLKQQAVVDRARLQRSYVAGVEAGRRNASVLSLARIARALGCDLVGMLAGDVAGRSRT